MAIFCRFLGGVGMGPTSPSPSFIPRFPWRICSAKRTRGSSASWRTSTTSGVARTAVIHCCYLMLRFSHISAFELSLKVFQSFSIISRYFDNVFRQQNRGSATGQTNGAPSPRYATLVVHFPPHNARFSSSMLCSRLCRFRISICTPKYFQFFHIFSLVNNIEVVLGNKHIAPPALDTGIPLAQVAHHRGDRGGDATRGGGVHEVGPPARGLRPGPRSPRCRSSLLSGFPVG